MEELSPLQTRGVRIEHLGNGERHKIYIYERKILNINKK